MKPLQKIGIALTAGLAAATFIGCTAKSYEQVVEKDYGCLIPSGSGYYSPITGFSGDADSQNFKDVESNLEAIAAATHGKGHAVNSRGAELLPPDKNDPGSVGNYLRQAVDRVITEPDAALHIEWQAMDKTQGLCSLLRISTFNRTGTPGEISDHETQRFAFPEADVIAHVARIMGIDNISVGYRTAK